MTELAIIGCDIQEIVGSATALQIIFGLPLYVGVIITIFDSILFLYVHYYGIRKLELLFVSLVVVMGLTFCSNMVIAEPDVNLMVEGLIIPEVPKGSWPAALGLIGAVIMPHNLYLHSSLVLTRRVNYKNKNEV